MERLDPDAAYFRFEYGYSLIGPARTQSRGPSNLDLWCDYLELPKEKAADIRSFYLRSDEKEFETVMEAIESDKPYPDKWLYNAMVQKVHDRMDPELNRYLIASKKWSDLCYREFDYWYEEQKELDYEAIQQALVEAKARVGEVKDKVLRRRYQFMAIRLAYYRKNYEAVEALFTDYTGKWDKDALFYDALNYRFGARWKASGNDRTPEQKAQAILMLSELVQSCTECHLIHYEELRLLNAADYIEAEKSLRKDQDKIDLWVLASVSSIPKEEAMIRIAEIDRNAPELKEIADAYLKESEQEVFNSYDQDRERSFSPDFEESLEMLSTHRRSRSKTYWRLYKSYVSYLTGNSNKALKDYERVEQEDLNTEYLITFHRRLGIIIRMDVTGWKQGQENDPDLVDDLKKTYSSNSDFLKTYVATRLQESFKDAEHGERVLLKRLVEAQQIHYQTNYRNSTLQDLQAAQRVIENPPNRLCEAILEVLGGQQSMVKEIHWVQGRYYLNENQFDQAVAYLSQAPDLDQELSADPFMIHLNDCHDCDFNAEHQTYTLLDFARTMAHLKQETRKKGGNPSAHHRFANGLYNKTHFGNARDAFDERFKDKEAYWDCKPAWKHYEIAARFSADREDKAFNTFLMAKCEQNTYYEETETDYYGWYSGQEKCDPEKNRNYRTAFRQLHDNYRNTELYKKAMRQCSYFEHFIDQHVEK